MALPLSYFKEITQVAPAYSFGFLEKSLINVKLDKYSTIATLRK